MHAYDVRTDGQLAGRVEQLMKLKFQFGVSNETVVLNRAFNREIFINRLIEKAAD